jgi:hypothetical protein
MSLKVGDRGRVILTYQDPKQKEPVSRSFYSSGGYVFEDLPTGDKIMTYALKVCEGTQAAVLATRETLPQVLRREYQRMKEL